MEYAPVSLVQFFGPGICILGLPIGECSHAGTTIIYLILPSLAFRLIVEKWHKDSIFFWVSQYRNKASTLRLTVFVWKYWQQTNLRDKRRRDGWSSSSGHCLCIRLSVISEIHPTALSCSSQYRSITHTWQSKLKIKYNSDTLIELDAFLVVNSHTELPTSMLHSRDMRTLHELREFKWKLWRTIDSSPDGAQCNYF